MSPISATRPPRPDGEPRVGDHVPSNGAPAKLRDDGAARFVALGYVTAVAMPLIGLILGVAVATRAGKPHSRHGAWIIVLSVVATVVWILIFTSGVINTTTSDFS